MESFEELVEQYDRMIWKIIHSLNIYKDEPEYYQTALIALWDAKNSFDESKGVFTSYAYSFIKGRLMSELSKRTKLKNKLSYPDEEFWLMIEDTNPQQPLDEAFILSYFNNLTDNQKKWVLYTALSNLSIKEIAKLEQVHPSAVKAWRKGAKEKIISPL